MKRSDALVVAILVGAVVLVWILSTAFNALR